MANSKIRGITIELSADATGVLDSIQDVSKQITSTKNQLKDVDNLLKLDPTNTELLEQKTKLLKDQIENTKTKLDALKAAQEDMKANGVDENSAQYQALQREIIATEQQLESLERTAGSGSATLATISAVTGEWGEKLTEAGKKASIVSAGIVAFGTAAVKAFNDVDEGADIVIKKTGATGEAAEALEQSYTNVAQNIVAEFTDIGTAVGEVSTRFHLTGTDLEDLSTTFLKFADINDIDVQTAVEGVDQALKTFNVDQSEANNVMGLLTLTAQNTGIGMGELLSNLQQYGPTLKEMGLDIDDAIILMGDFEEAGIDSSDMLSKLQKAATYYNEQGLSMSEGLADLVARLQNSETAADATAEAYEIFGKRGGLAFITAAQEGKLSIGDLENSMGDYSTVVDDTYNATLDGTDKMALAWQNVQIAMGALGEAIGNTLAPIMDSLIVVIQDVTDWFSSLDESTQSTIVTIGLIVAAIGPLLLILGKVFSAISTITGALSSIGTVMTGPIGLVIAAVAALGAGVIALIDTFNNSMLATSPFAQALSDIAEANETLSTSIKNTKTAYEDSAGSADANAAAASTLYERLQNLITAYDGTAGAQQEISSTVNALNQLIPGLGLSWDSVTNSLNLTNEEISNNINAMKAQAQAAALMDYYTESLKLQYEANKNVETAQGLLNDTLAEYGLTLEDVSNYSANNVAANQQITSKIAEVYDGFFNTGEVIEICQMALESYNDACDNAKDVSEDVTWAESQLGDAMTAAAEATEDAGGKIIDTTNSVNEGVNFDPAIEEAGRAGSSIPSEMQNGISNNSYLATDEAEDLADDVAGAFDDLPDEMNTAGSSSASELNSSFGDWNGTVSDTVDGMYDLFYTALGTYLPGMMWTWGDTAGSKFESGLSFEESYISATIDSIVDTVYNSANSLKWKMQSAGYFAGSGLYSGLSSWAASIYNLAWSIANSINAAARAALVISSPSKALEEVGMFTGEGLEKGLAKSAPGIYATMDTIASNLASGMIPDMGEGVAALNSASSSSAGRAAAAGANNLDTVLGLLSQYLPYLAEDTNIVLDDGTLAGHMAPAMNTELQRLAVRSARG